MKTEGKEYSKKQFYSIGEVSEILGTNESTLRFWEREFKEIKPRRASRGVRMYSNSDLETIKLIHYLVKEKGLTLDGAKKRLKENTSKESNTMEVLNRLKAVRAELMSIRNYIEILETDANKSEKRKVEAEPAIYETESQTEFKIEEDTLTISPKTEVKPREDESPILSLF